MEIRILGVDPGSRKAGYGVVEYKGSEIRYVISGTIRLDAKQNIAKRLLVLYEQISSLLHESQVNSAAVERVFVSKNIDSALKLGHTRGVILLAIAQLGIPIAEYPASVIKKTLTKRGRADKHQISSMVSAVLGIEKTISEDEADALAVAVCHIFHLSEKEVVGRSTP